MRYPTSLPNVCDARRIRRGRDCDGRWNVQGARSERMCTYRGRISRAPRVFDLLSVGRTRSRISLFAFGIFAITRNQLRRNTDKSEHPSAPPPSPSRSRASDFNICAEPLESRVPFAFAHSPRCAPQRDNLSDTFGGKRFELRSICREVISTTRQAAYLIASSARGI